MRLGCNPQTERKVICIFCACQECDRIILFVPVIFYSSPSPNPIHLRGCNIRGLALSQMRTAFDKICQQGNCLSGMESDCDQPTQVYWQRCQNQAVQWGLKSRQMQNRIAVFVSVMKFHPADVCYRMIQEEMCIGKGPEFWRCRFVWARCDWSATA